MEVVLDLGDGRRAGIPVFLRIARAIAADIQRGRLAAGDVLPGTRTLARSLGVHRNTVLAAYRELGAEGYIDAESSQHTRVSADLPAKRRRKSLSQGADGPRPAAPAFDLSPGLERVDSPPIPNRRPRAIALYGGMPDLALVPVKALARAYRRALVGAIDTPLAYGDPRGDVGLRSELAKMLSASRGLALSPDEIIVTRGSQMALYLAARAIVSQGDVVLAEAWGYRPAYEALRLAGAELVPIPVDTRGIDTERIAEIASKRTIRAVYVTPHHQYPTTVLLSQRRRAELVTLARTHRFAILEDDYDHEFHYDGRPVLPLASIDTAGSVVYLGTFSKIVAPGIRIGFAVARRNVIDRMTAHRVLVDRQGDLAVERAVAELVADGEIERHARRMRRTYLARRDALVDAIETHLAGTLEVTLPRGGMAIWARAHDIDVERWAERAAERGVLLQTAKRFTFDRRPRPYLRLGFAGETEERIRTAIRTMAQTR